MDKDEPLKNKIFLAAIQLFSEKGCDSVSVRDIAQAVDCSPAEVYKCYACKAEVLDDIYNFFEETINKYSPRLDELLELAETTPPLELMLKTNFHYPRDLQPLMDKIITIATIECRHDNRSQDFIERCIMDLPRRIAAPLLEKMIQLGKIEPMDIDAFVILEANYCYSATLRNSTTRPVTYEEWYRGQNIIYQLIKPVVCNE
jgi:AcrR family transcriptional regulator